MAVDAKHPSWKCRADEWIKMGDTHEGEKAVKAKRTEYLPPTEGMVLDGMNNVMDKGYMAYERYLMRAMFPDFVKQGVEAMIGVMHREEARIEVPDKMKPLLERMTVNGESAQMVLRRINMLQLRDGRLGLLVEAPDGKGPDALPYLAVYEALSIINWDEGTRADGKQRTEFVSLDESGWERIGSFEWEYFKRYRMLSMSRTVETMRESNQEEKTDVGVYEVAVLPRGETAMEKATWKTPSIAGTELQSIPFIFINARDLVSTPETPPLLGLANLCLAIYRGEADYRQTLFMQGQETLVLIGVDDDKAVTRMGAGSKIVLPRDSDAKFVGVSALGLGAMRQSLDDDRQAAGEVTTRLMDAAAGGQSYASGTALKVRVSAKTATLKNISMTGAEALKQALRIIAEWIGEDPDKVIVEANTQFADTSQASKTLLELGQAQVIGVPISDKSIHRFMVKNDLTEMTYDDERGEIESQPPKISQTAGAFGGLGKSTGGDPVKRDAGTKEPAPGSGSGGK